MNGVKQILENYEELKCIYQGLEDVFQIFIDECDNTIIQSNNYMVDNFKRLLIRVAYAALELRLLYCPTDVMIDPFYSIVLKFPDERINIAFDMNGEIAIYLVEGCSLMDATVETYKVQLNENYDDLKTKLTNVLHKLKLQSL